LDQATAEFNKAAPRMQALGQNLTLAKYSRRLEALRERLRAIAERATVEATEHYQKAVNFAVTNHVSYDAALRALGYAA
jgi:hypothetical protein